MSQIRCNRQNDGEGGFLENLAGGAAAQRADEGGAGHTDR